MSGREYEPDQLQELGPAELLQLVANLQHSDVGKIEEAKEALQLVAEMLSAAQHALNHRLVVVVEPEAGGNQVDLIDVKLGFLPQLMARRVSAGEHLADELELDLFTQQHVEPINDPPRLRVKRLLCIPPKVLRSQLQPDGSRRVKR